MVVVVVHLYCSFEFLMMSGSISGFSIMSGSILFGFLYKFSVTGSFFISIYGARAGKGTRSVDGPHPPHHHHGVRSLMELI